jgi:hypothetical protein
MIHLDSVLNPCRTTFVIGNWYYGRTRLLMANILRLKGVRVFVVPDEPKKYKMVLKGKPNIRILNGEDFSSDKRVFSKLPALRHACREILRGDADLLVVDELRPGDDPAAVLVAVERVPVWLVLENKPLGVSPLRCLELVLAAAGADRGVAEKFADCLVVRVGNSGVYLQETARSVLTKVADVDDARNALPGYSWPDGLAGYNF